MKKGFTLIELLAVIVILAIIALIATPIVLSIIDDSKASSTIRSAEGYLRAVEYEIAQAYVTPNRITEGTFNVLSGGNICIDGYSNNECTGGVLEIEYNNEGPLSGTITLEEAKITHYTLTYPSGITVVDGKVGDEIEDVVKVCSLTLDENGNGIADTGDMIKCSTESFHVIENDGTTISMLAQYNLDVGTIWNFETGDINVLIENPTGIQNELALGCNDTDICYGVVNFSGANYWYDWDTNEYMIDAHYATEGRDYPFVYGDYKDVNGNYLNLMYPYVEAYEKYLKDEGVVSVHATLISYEQLIDLGCVDGESCLEENSWIYTTSYYSGSINETDSYRVDYDGSFYLSSSSADYYGIRPVINISVNEL